MLDDVDGASEMTRAGVVAESRRLESTRGVALGVTGALANGAGVVALGDDEFVRRSKGVAFLA
jgi:hypothetical protein